MGAVTPEIINRWIELHPTTGLEEMVRITGFSTGTIRRYLTAAGVKPKPLAWRKNKRTDAERFFEKVDKKTASPCWIWMGGLNNKRYGQFAIKIGRYVGKDKTGWGMKLAHRFSYEIARGPVPDGLVLDHLCRMPSCVNPDHLEPVTQIENCRRGLSGSPETHPSAALNRAKTHCPRGHAYDAENTYTNKRGQRCCKICKNASTARAAKKRREEHARSN